MAATRPQAPDPFTIPMTGLSIVPPPDSGAPAGPGVAFRAMDPTRGAQLPTEFRAATGADIDRAGWQAWQAFYSTQERPGRDRAELLDQAARYLADRTPQVLSVVTDETGLGPARVVSECERTVGTLRMLAGLARAGEWSQPSIDPGQPSRRPVPKPDLRKMLRPLGPVAVFGTAAFPLAFGAAGADVASALAAGCAVIVKGHPDHPGTGELVARCVADAVRDTGFHPGLYSFLHAGGTADHAVGAALVKHPCVRAVGFTGSGAGGQAVGRLASQRTDPIPVFAQMGSTNPVFLMPDAVEHQAEEITPRLIAAALAAGGQMCTCPRLVFMARSNSAEDLIKALARPFNDAQPQVMLSHRIRAVFARRIAEITALPGVDLRAGSPNAGHSGGAEPAPRLGHSVRCSPVLFRTTFDVFARTPALHEECFGPALTIVLCESEDQLLQAATAIQGSLTATIWAAPADIHLAGRVHAVLEQRAGRLVYNSTPVSLEVCASTVHGGPHPVASQPHATGVGPASIARWCRPVCYQNTPDPLLPPALRSANPLKLERLVDGRPTRERLTPRAPLRPPPPAQAA
ncbi:MAG: aldehyde dehydrogenase family protein [Phycisphaerales bacterium]|nr:aldehyde dehydrogenase family protein [Phycisphaerales bacterium]